MEATMLISVVNHTNGKLTDEQVQDGIRAVNRQIAHDFKPHWHIGAELRLEGASATPDGEKLPELRGDAIIYLWDERRRRRRRSASTTPTPPACRSGLSSPSW